MTAQQLTVTVLVATLFSSCLKTDQETKREKAVAVAVASGDAYEYSLGAFEDGEQAAIQQQAAHYQRSELQQDGTTGEVVYHYRSNPGFTGTDSVTLKSTKRSGGASSNNEILITRLTIDLY